MTSEEKTARITTEQLATLLGVRSTSIRTALSLKGSYWGLRPIKAPNGRLLWNRNEAEALLQKAA